MNGRLCILVITKSCVTLHNTIRFSYRYVVDAVLRNVSNNRYIQKYLLYFVPCSAPFLYTVFARNA